MFSSLFKLKYSLRSVYFSFRLWIPEFVHANTERLADQSTTTAAVSAAAAATTAAATAAATEQTSHWRLHELRQRLVVQQLRRPEQGLLGCLFGR